MLRMIKHKARILVPDAVTLVGVADPYNRLPEGYIYARTEQQGEVREIEGNVCISRSPCEHPVSVLLATLSLIC